MNEKIKGRFAPSPTGRMHLGNIFSAMLSWLSARSKGGQWLLRIEDIDPQRSRQQYADLIMSDLEWLGLTWDEGPFYQSQRSDIYAQYLEKLAGMGLVYPCYCTRADILATQAPHESDGRVVYKGTCRPKETGLSATALPDYSKGNAAAALRLMVPERTVTFTDGHYGSHSIDLAKHVGDFIVRRKDGAWAYQLAVVVDDALMGITEVVRGRDLLLSSPQQIFLAELLGFPAPSFTHLPLLCNTAAQRLSKRDKSLDTESLRERFTANELLGILAHTAGLIPEPFPVTAEELSAIFSWDKVPVDDIKILL